MLVKKIEPETEVAQKSPLVLSYGFRIFFILVAAYSVLLIPIWLSLLFFNWPGPTAFPLLFWHSHEILFGVVAGAIAGFVLTAMSTWTGKSPLQGWALGGLAMLWVLARVVMIYPGSIPPTYIAILDLAFLSLLLCYVAWVIISSGNIRNLIIILVLLVFLSANFVMHLGVINKDFILVEKGKILAFDTVTLLMIVVAGRIIPAFTANWLRRTGGDPELIYSNAILDGASIASAALLIPVDWYIQSEFYQSLLYALVAALSAVRLITWKGWLCRKEPLLWILHLGYTWIVLALLLRALTVSSNLFGPSTWVHALGVGAISTLILGVMTRVSLGHTGRALILPKGAVTIYYLITLAALTRIIYSTEIVTNSAMLLVSGLSWSGAFLLFLFLYWNILVKAKPVQYDLDQSK